ncbi:hypothetical protein NUW54_g9656 [Trametes sanguinea]|uniref:Uncharacterized protein n=1 Tax=Trametes sanguinea TaxID=158606 RepID=A0ACC1P6L3_9APHY|nr:hypothetical protein NUW54_g9656 [Trametes sanguinea]
MLIRLSILLPLLLVGLVCAVSAEQHTPRAAPSPYMWRALPTGDHQMTSPSRPYLSLPAERLMRALAALLSALLSAATTHTYLPVAACTTPFRQSSSMSVAMPQSPVTPRGPPRYASTTRQASANSSASPSSGPSHAAVSFLRVVRTCLAIGLLHENWIGWYTSVRVARTFARAITFYLGIRQALLHKFAPDLDGYQFSHDHNTFTYRDFPSTKIDAMLGILNHHRGKSCAAPAIIVDGHIVESDDSQRWANWPVVPGAPVDKLIIYLAFPSQNWIIRKALGENGFEFEEIQGRA